MRFSLLRAIGWGIVLYAVMYLSWGFMISYGIQGTFISRILLLAVLIISTIIAARHLPVHNVKDVLPYSLLWGLTIMIIDGCLAAPSGSWNIYADPNLWVGYALVVIVPLILPQKLQEWSVPDIT